ncbi:alkane 1-monooxygenase [Simiduia curdlanivorans]|uniref:Alkane 1-monooxygenase n=1 Tax=Simiduia curdlanivorans TaxID=1492769 RepID=A0ABV8V2H0_9GAMM|nr:alkane 1-monooxygenase [Simiduia curdlanivorans]MDN3637844.1 alkane 1-monooxygenase [Simiduia curdlanivorans]
MKYFIPTTAAAETEPRYYIDHKRHWWLASLFVPLVTVLGPLLYLIEPNTWLLALPFLIFYGCVPLLDYWVGEDDSNPPESVVPQLESDPYYRAITIALVPVIWVSFLFSAWFIGSQDLRWFEVLMVSLSSGLICGFGINLAHEMGHKTHWLSSNLAKTVLALSAYGHFTIEHNRGHHRFAATKEDPASARMGESIYQFVQREIPQCFLRAWHLETKRIAKKGHRPWSLANEIIQCALISVVLYASLLIAFGSIMLVYLAVVISFSAFQLTSANYIEHYGLLRQKNQTGRYEPVQPKHSWNSNHKVSNWLLFHLQRHSDHHANPTRAYQSLRTFDSAPQLPSGYFGMYILAYIPPLWRRIMDPKVMVWAGGDVDRVNRLGGSA